MVRESKARGTCGFSPKPMGTVPETFKSLRLSSVTTPAEEQRTPVQLHGDASAGNQLARAPPPPSLILDLKFSKICASDGAHSSTQHKQKHFHESHQRLCALPECHAC